MEPISHLVEAARASDRRALARILTILESGGARADEARNALHPYLGKAHIVGVTGSPGSGKSTLVSALVKAFRAGGFGQEAAAPQTVAVLAVDPSSPFSGGALLGDRIRMRDLFGDKGVFIRSMASRGASGGLAIAAEGAMQALDAAGFDVVLVETVGAGQSEVEVARHAHSVVVVEAPGLGDDIQALKAGILEIANILVVNKKDLPGAEDTARALQGMLEMGAPRDPAWKVPVMQTAARTGEGVAALTAEVARHKAYLQKSGLWDRREELRVKRELETRLRERLMEEWCVRAPAGAMEDALRRVLAHELTPAEAVEKLLK